MVTGDKVRDICVDHQWKDRWGTAWRLGDGGQSGRQTGWRELREKAKDARETRRETETVTRRKDTRRLSKLEV
jgi:hypothetical protein